MFDFKQNHRSEMEIDSALVMDKNTSVIDIFSNLSADKQIVIKSKSNSEKLDSSYFSFKSKNYRKNDK